MNFSTLIEESNLNINIDKALDFKVEGLAYDSRKVNKNFIFFAIKGNKVDGNIFIKDVLEKGAKVIFSEKSFEQNFYQECKQKKVQLFKISNIKKIMAVISHNFFGKPSCKLKLIGVTGTNGKTTITHLVNAILEEAGHHSGLIGTISNSIGEKKIASSLTTPESIDINFMLNEMLKNNIEYCAMEVSSIALHSDRVYGLNIDTAVFTNLTNEHLDYHKDIDDYFKAKKILFDNLNKGNFAISNSDCKYGVKILENTKARKKFYSIDAQSDYKASNIKIDFDGIKFDLKEKDETHNISSNLIGRFNVYNLLAAISVARIYNIDFEIIKMALSKFSSVDGRFNRIKLANGSIAIIDYSHTSDSLKNAIETAKNIVNKCGRVITIFGCGGNRDKTKRPVMGNISTNLSDYTIITSDNPRDEEPMEIINEIKAGIIKEYNYEVEVDREKAIKKGLKLSKNGDIILICGKGHETYQEIKGVKYDFDDKKIVEKYMKEAKE